MIDIYLYGKLRSYTKNKPDGAIGRIDIEPWEGETVIQLLERLQIPMDEIYTIFVNRKLLAAKSGMATWLRHRQASADPLAWDLNLPLNPDDRIGLFGRDMAALVI